MTLAEILRHKGSSVVTVDGRSSIHQAVRTLVDRNIGAVVVTGDDGSLGILSERDILRFMAGSAPDVDGTRVESIMTRELITARPDTSVAHAMELVTENRVRHLPILESGELAGIVSIGDLVNALRTETERENHHLKDYIATAG